jgi:hypothetical protein
VYVKDGIITWETQQTDYPSNGPDMPEYEPRGCPRDASFSPGYTYSPLRIRYPYIRGVLLEMYREAKSRPWEAGERLGASIDFDSREHAMGCQIFRDGHTARRRLPDRFVEEDVTPLIDSPMPTALMSMSRYARRVSAVDGIPIAAKRLATVGRLSSAARIP